MNYLMVIYKSGPVMWVILLISILALIFFIEKVMQFHRDEINVPELLRGLRNALQRNALVEALSICDNAHGPVARLLGAAILAYQNGDDDLHSAMDETAMVEIPKLERHISVIGTFGFILPLLGFLGTVLGMTDAFEVTRNTSGMVPELANAIGFSLITSAAGLTAAVICYVAHNYLVARMNMILWDMEKAALEITSFLGKKRSGGVR